MRSVWESPRSAQRVPTKAPGRIQAGNLFQDTSSLATCFALYLHHNTATVESFVSHVNVELQLNSVLNPIKQ
ncbi:hypothetical protein J6590_079049 [Homalodisca vitripennis]|nr:hypothetical protein J6590_079049 [Homalodisca vitripennis]